MPHCFGRSVENSCWRDKPSRVIFADSSETPRALRLPIVLILLGRRSARQDQVRQRGKRPVHAGSDVCLWYSSLESREKMALAVKIGRNRRVAYAAGSDCSDPCPRGERVGGGIQKRSARVQRSGSIAAPRPTSRPRRSQGPGRPLSVSPSIQGRRRSSGSVPGHGVQRAGGYHSDRSRCFLKYGTREVPKNSSRG